MPVNIFVRNYSSLSVKDLLDAREAYHVHLIMLPTVVATAIGRFRFHFEDPCARDPDARAKYGETPPRTLADTVVRPWSWPCVMVFVKDWYDPKDLSQHATEAIPRLLYLPDGRIIPTCVIKARPSDQPIAPVERLGFPDETIGGGYPCYIRSQGREQNGTLGALVSREGATFALTNRHVTGREGQEIFAFVKGESVKIGESHPYHVGKKLFKNAYPGWPGEHTIANLDAGLILVDDLSDWTSQVFGIGEVGPVMDMNVHSISLDLIGTPIRAFGSTSGPSEGEIQGLFYRYCTRGGADYVTDLLIGPRTEGLLRGADEGSKPGVEKPRLNIHPGDSGTLVFYDPPRREAGKEETGAEAPERARRLEPMAMLWGCVPVESKDGEEPDQYGLGTFLSTICRELDVELVNAWNTGYREYWGKSAHFKVGYKFCDLLRSPKVRELIRANRERIGFADDMIGKGAAFSIGRGKYVPLADVPDYVWVGMSKSGGASGPRANELPQHFADMDEPAPGNGPSLFDLCGSENGDNLTAEVWRDYYAKFDGLPSGPEPGMLPFRIRQIYEAMVAALKGGQLMEFVASAGILSHYVADASIPLHLSYLHHGSRAPRRDDEAAYAKFKKKREYKVHSLFEQRMFEVRATELLKMIDGKLDRQQGRPVVKGGKQAIGRAFSLMQEAFKLLPPQEIIKCDVPQLTARERAEVLFGGVGEKAATCVAKACVALADLVESAWKEGGGDRLLDGSAAKTYSERELQSLYRSRGFLPALTFEQLIGMGY
jgi:hypothetical protein